MLGQCQISKTWLIVHAQLHLLISMELSWLGGQIREKGSLHAGVPRCCAQARQESIRTATGTGHKKCRRDETKLRCKANEQICTTSPCGIYRNTNLSCFQTEVFLTAKGQGFFLFVFNKTRVFVMPTNPDIQFNVRYVPNTLWIWTITS